MSEIVAEETVLEPLETALLEACRPCFADELRLPSAATCTEIAQRALVLERGAAEARNGILRADVLAWLDQPG